MLAGTEVAAVKALIGGKDAHQRHIVEVQALGNHLGTDHEGDLLVGKALKQLTVGDRGIHGIGVNAQNPGVRESPAQFLLGHLGSRAEEAKAPAA